MPWYQIFLKDGKKLPGGPFPDPLSAMIHLVHKNGQIGEFPQIDPVNDYKGSSAFLTGDSAEAGYFWEAWEEHFAGGHLRSYESRDKARANDWKTEFELMELLPSCVCSNEWRSPHMSGFLPQAQMGTGLKKIASEHIGVDLASESDWSAATLAIQPEPPTETLDMEQVYKNEHAPRPAQTAAAASVLAALYGAAPALAHDSAAIKSITEPEELTPQEVLTPEQVAQAAEDTRLFQEAISAKARTPEQVKLLVDRYRVPVRQLPPVEQAMYHGEAFILYSMLIEEGITYPCEGTGVFLVNPAEKERAEKWFSERQVKLISPSRALRRRTELLIGKKLHSENKKAEKLELRLGRG